MAPGQHYKLTEIPFLDAKELRSARFLPALMFYDGTWSSYVQIGEDDFVQLHAWPAEAVYFATTPERPDDLAPLFLNFLAQRANTSVVSGQYRAILDDLFNLSASFAKLDMIHRSKSEGASRMATTEIEYLFVICRSLFDHLQEVVSRLWDLIQVPDAASKKRQLPASFKDMALKARAVRSAEEIAAQFRVPDYLAECYARHGPVFLKLRDFRDRLVHGGHQLEHLFNAETGFLINKRLGPFLDLDVWTPQEEAPNELVPLLPALGMIVATTLMACDDFAVTLMQNIRFPNPIVPKMNLFIRGYCNSEFVAVLSDASTRMTDGRSLMGSRASAG